MMMLMGLGMMVAVGLLTSVICGVGSGLGLYVANAHHGETHYLPSMPQHINYFGAGDANEARVEK